jgi:hypothetical protein
MLDQLRVVLSSAIVAARAVSDLSAAWNDLPDRSQAGAECASEEGAGRHLRPDFGRGGGAFDPPLGAAKVTIEEAEALQARLKLRRQCG